MQHFDICILPGEKAGVYCLPLLGRSVLARMMDRLGQVTDGRLWWPEEEAPDDVETCTGSYEGRGPVLEVYKPCPLVSAKAWARLTDGGSAQLWSGDALLAQWKNGPGEPEELSVRTEEGVHTETAAGFAAALDELRRRVNERLMSSGVLIWDPANAFISPEAQVGPGTEIRPGCQILGNTRVGADCVVGPNTMLKDARIGDRVTVNQSQVLESAVGADTQVGPFTYIRPGCSVGEHCRVGDFVELKKAQVGSGTKIAHLTYVGDATLGQRVNIGCGTVFANYDGKSKYRSTVGDDVFIGCNTNLISPVHVADRVYIATGTTVNEDVTEPDSLVIGRPRQNVKPGWVQHRKEIGKL